MVLASYPQRAWRIALFLKRGVWLAVLLVQYVYVPEIIKPVPVYVIYVGHGLLIFGNILNPRIYILT